MGLDSKKLFPDVFIEAECVYFDLFFNNWLTLDYFKLRILGEVVSY